VDSFFKAVATWPFVHGFLFVALALFPIVNPPGMAPVFLNYTEGLDDATVVRLARRVAINSFFLTAASLVIGPLALKFFGLSLPAVRVAGGLVLAVAGWRLLNQGQEDSKHRAPAASPEDVLNGAFYPLTLPLTVGPGSVAVMVTLGSSLLGGADPLASGALLDFAGAIVGLALVSVLIYICYSEAERILGRLGATGVNVMLRLSAFILLCIGVQIALEGLSAIFSGHT
jgi:multiple antibiotic resistance protein